MMWLLQKALLVGEGLLLLRSLLHQMFKKLWKMTLILGETVREVNLLVIIGLKSMLNR